MLAEKIDDMKVPTAMEPPALMEKKDKKAETLPVHADMKKLWVPNEDGVLDEQYKDAPTLAKIKEPTFKQEESSSSGVSHAKKTKVTILPETVTNATAGTITTISAASTLETSPSTASLALISQKDLGIYATSTSSPKKYGERLMDLATTLVNTANQAKEYDPSLKPSISAAMDTVTKTITDGSAPGSATALQLQAKADASVIMLENSSNAKKRQNIVQQEGKIDMKVFDQTPQSELEVVTLQIDQLAQIKVVAEKLKQLRDDRDKEKKLFDEEANKLTSIRSSINEQKESLKAMYQKAGIAIPKTINLSS